MPAAESDESSTPHCLPYRAPFWLPSGHAQTIHAATWVRRPNVTYWRERWETPDFDFIDLGWVDNPHQELALGQQHDTPLEGIERIAGDAMGDFYLHQNARTVKCKSELTDLLKQMW